MWNAVLVSSNLQSHRESSSEAKEVETGTNVKEDEENLPKSRLRREANEARLRNRAAG